MLQIAEMLALVLMSLINTQFWRAWKKSDVRSENSSEKKNAFRFRKKKILGSCNDFNQFIAFVQPALDKPPSSRC